MSLIKAMTKYKSTPQMNRVKATSPMVITSFTIHNKAQWPATSAR